MGVFIEGEMESEFDKICNDITGETRIDNAVGNCSNRVEVLLDSIFPEKRATVRHNMKWSGSEAKHLKIKCRTYEKKWVKTKKPRI